MPRCAPGFIGTPIDQSGFGCPHDYLDGRFAASSIARVRVRRPSVRWLTPSRRATARARFQPRAPSGRTHIRRSCGRPGNVAGYRDVRGNPPGEEPAALARTPISLPRRGPRTSFPLFLRPLPEPSPQTSTSLETSRSSDTTTSTSLPQAGSASADCWASVCVVSEAFGGDEDVHIPGAEADRSARLELRARQHVRHGHGGGDAHRLPVPVVHDVHASAI